MDRINIPTTIAGNKSPTLNGTGYVFYTISPVGKAFLENECKPNKSVIDIGAGYSNIPIEAIKSGVGKYVANDSALEHLQILLQKVKDTLNPEALDNLSIIHGSAPKDLPVVQNEYDAILADKVIHFMQPAEIIQFIAWAKQALKQGGKVYITTASPYSKRYNALLPQYLERLHNNEKFPGHFKNMQQFIERAPMENYANYTVPDEMVLFSRSDLIDLFASQGMQVIASYSLMIPTDEEVEWQQVSDTASNVVGIIAVRQ